MSLTNSNYCVILLQREHWGLMDKAFGTFQNLKLKVKGDWVFAVVAPTIWNRLPLAVNMQSQWWCPFHKHLTLKHGGFIVLLLELFILLHVEPFLVLCITAVLYFILECVCPLCSSSLLLVQYSLLTTYLPIHKADRVSYSRLNNLSARKDAPCHSIGLHVRGIGQVTALHTKNLLWYTDHL